MGLKNVRKWLSARIFFSEASLINISSNCTKLLKKCFFTSTAAVHCQQMSLRAATANWVNKVIKNVNKYCSVARRDKSVTLFRNPRQCGRFSPTHLLLLHYLWAHCRCLYLHYIHHHSPQHSYQNHYHCHCQCH